MCGGKPLLGSSISDPAALPVINLFGDSCVLMCGLFFISRLKPLGTSFSTLLYLFVGFIIVLEQLEGLSLMQSLAGDDPFWGDCPSSLSF